MNALSAHQLRSDQAAQPLRVGVLTNPFARGNQGRRAGALRNQRLREQVTQSTADVPAAVDALLDGGATVLAINGGDGTFGAAIAHLERRGLELPLIPVLGGTNNSIAKDARAIGRIDRVAARVERLG